MKEFDEIIGGKFGILKGGKNLVFIKTGRGGTIFGYGNKYLKICNLLYEKYGCTFVVSANPIDSLCDLEDEIRQIGEYVGEYDEIYFVGVSNGANVGAQQCWKIDKIKNALLINGPIMINWHKTKSGAEKFKGEQIRFVYGFPRSTYYAVINHKPSRRDQEYDKFSTQVLSVYAEFKKRYGAIKIQRELSDRGIPCSVNRVQRHMRHLGIKSIVIKKYQYSKNQGKVPDNKENILNRNFEADTVYKKLVTDITYIHVKNEGWTYLASVMDLYDRKIIGWSYGKNITAELATQAVRNACINIPDTKGIILHSDLGSQYTSDVFEKYLQSQGILHSFSRKGNPYDNACIESFHSVLKKEEVYTTTYQTFEEAKTALFEYIESFYNRKRRHSALGYKTPQQVEDEALAA